MQMKFKNRRWLILFGLVVVLVAAAWALSSHWWPSGAAHASAEAAHEHEHDHTDAEHDHSHPGHSEAVSIELSEKALKNIGFQPTTIKLDTFEKVLTIPAIIVEQPGRTQVRITAPLTGVITDIFATQGQAVDAGSPMFDIRLTHEELVTAQRDYLQTTENLDVVNREIARLQTVGDGVIAGKQILERQYEKQKLEATLRAAEQALLLHGLSQEQIQEIFKTRKLLQSLTIRAPAHSHTGDGTYSDHLFHVQKLPVSLGQQVEAGQELCVLADHFELFIEGRAFEDDAARLREANRHGWDVTAKLLVGDKQSQDVKGLKLLYLADQVDPDSRAFRFYLRLPNEVTLDQKSPSGLRFVEWRFKPGQRMELRVPVELWEKRIVLPVDAVVEEGAETYVYRQNGDHFDRVPVHVEYRDPESVVVANDGSVFPGDIVAGRGAYQIHLALKNKSGGGIDPHAGHNH
jgi:multidrug efflux pump subunit AcrA (membrane-fusion protein)